MCYRVFVECGFPFQYGKVPDAAMLTKMYEMSPISCIDSLKAPVLFLVGKNDARVPPSQSINFYKMLLARGVHTEWVDHFLFLGARGSERKGGGCDNYGYN